MRGKEHLPCEEMLGELGLFWRREQISTSVEMEFWPSVPEGSLQEMWGKAVCKGQDMGNGSKLAESRARWDLGKKSSL